MNILNNNTEQFIQNRQGPVTILGNQNVIHIRNSSLNITVNGNNNRFLIDSAQLNIQVNGNHNKFTNKRSNLVFGFNGSGNQIFHDPSSVYRNLYCNGTNNIFPNLSPNNRNNNERQQRNPQNQNRNRRNQQRPPQRYQFQPEAQYIESQQRAPRQNHRNRYNFQAQQPHVPPQNLFQGFPYNGNFWQQLQMMLPNFHTNPIRRNRRPNNIVDNQYNIQYNQMGPRRAVFVFDGGSQEEAEQKGLNMQQFNLLPTSNHVGRTGNCTICLQDIKQGEQETYLICFHAFHPICIRDWITKNAKCPVCQFDLKEYFQS